MNEELGNLINELVKRGASDEEIDIVVKDYQSSMQPSAPVESDPTALETGGHALGGFNKVVTDTAPQMLRGAGIATSKAADLLRQGTNAIGLTNDQVPISPESNPLYKAGQQIEQWKERNLDYTPDSR